MRGAPRKFLVSLLASPPLIVPLHDYMSFVLLNKVDIMNIKCCLFLYTLWNAYDRTIYALFVGEGNIYICMNN